MSSLDLNHLFAFIISVSPLCPDLLYWMAHYLSYHGPANKWTCSIKTWPTKSTRRTTVNKATDTHGEPKTGRQLTASLLCKSLYHVKTGPKSCPPSSCKFCLNRLQQLIISELLKYYHSYCPLLKLDRLLSDELFFSFFFHLILS